MAADWIDELEIEDAKIKWAFSHFDGREDLFNAPGDHNFQIMLTDEMSAVAEEAGWNVRHMDPYEEGDPMDHLLKAKISYKYESPRIFLIKGNRKIRAEQRDLAEITQMSTERIDVILSPSRWERQGVSGVTAYVKELYATIKQNRFSERYADFEEI